MTKEDNKIGLLGASSIGVGAIVGGGILVLGGVALQETGASAWLAFGLNGFIAILTALSIAEMCSLFPESGGIYTFAKRIWSVRAGFAFGWIIWLAHLVTALLYAIGFSAYFAEAASSLGTLYLDKPFSFLSSSAGQFLIASFVVLAYSMRLSKSAHGGSHIENILKLILFSLLIAGGAKAALASEGASLTEQLSPMLPNGLAGLGAAMGLSFIALQGFEVIAGVGGELKNPSKTAPWAMIGSLVIALLVYIPLLLIVTLVGVPSGEAVSSWCGERASTCFADAARNFMGNQGYWLVVAAALFSTLSALQANLLTASRLVQRMAEDRTFPRPFALIHKKFHTPVTAIAVNLFVILFLLGFVRTVGLAASAASLIFLIIYALSHRLSYVARKRAPKNKQMVKSPFFPAVPIIGGTCSAALAIFQGISQPGAGAIALIWLLLGGLLYRIYFSRRAEAVDAYMQAFRPEFISYRGQTPLVLVPITNPQTAPELVRIAHALAAHDTGKVMLLRVVKSEAENESVLKEEIRNAHEVLDAALIASNTFSNSPAEALLTLSNSPWREISRVAKQHQCKSMVLGVNRFEAYSLKPLLQQLEGDVAILSAPKEWTLADTKKILVPVGGKAHHDLLRAGLLGTLMRSSSLEEICFFSVIPENASRSKEKDTLKRLTARTQDEAKGIGSSLVIRSNEPGESILETSANYDMLLLGLTLMKQGQIDFSPLSVKLAKEAQCATLIIGRAS